MCEALPVCRNIPVLGYIGHLWKIEQVRLNVISLFGGRASMQKAMISVSKLAEYLFLGTLGGLLVTEECVKHYQCTGFWVHWTPEEKNATVCGDRIIHFCFPECQNLILCRGTWNSDDSHWFSRVSNFDTLQGHWNNDNSYMFSRRGEEA